MILVIFGITGDLSKRYLLPALYHLFKDGQLTDETKIVGLTRQSLTADELFGQVELCINEIDNICDPEGLRKIRTNTELLQFDPENSDDYAKLLEHLNSIEEAEGTCMNRLYYLSIPPELFSQTVHNLGAADLNTSCQHGKAATSLLVEKPFGSDVASAQKLVDETNQVFKEEQIFRIDHYLAKETVQHILAFRRSNPELEAMWNKQAIASIEVIAKESLGVGNRVKFYDKVGALRDVVQSHLLQLLAVSTMELAETREKLLSAIAPIAPEQAIRGQYDGYLQEADGLSASTETFVQATLHIASERWEAVPMTIETGKSLDEKRTQIIINFKDDETGTTVPLIFGIYPNDGIFVGAGEDSPRHALLQKAVDAYNSQHDTPLSHEDAYERVLLDATKGDRMLFATSQQVLEGWRIIEPLLEAWQDSTEGIQVYQPGSTGP